MNIQTNKNIPWIGAGCFFAFFLFGFTDNLKGPTIPFLLKELHFSYTIGGTILMFAYIGFFVATLFSGVLSDILGKKAVIQIAAISLLIGISGYIISKQLLSLVCSIIFVGIALGSFELGCNSIIIDLYKNKTGKYLNMLGFFHGVGSMAAPLYAGQLLVSGFSWRSIYGFTLPFSAMLLIFLFIVKYPAISPIGRKNVRLIQIGKAAFTKDMGWLYLLIFSYVAAELGISSWLVEFLQKIKFQPVQISTLMLSIYFGAMTLGRLFGSFVVERIGYIRIMTCAISLSILCIILGIYGPPLFAFLLPMSGLFFSIIFPTATAMVSGLHKTNAGTILGLFFAAAGIGGMAGPWAIGIFSDIFGLQFGLATVITFCLITLASLFALSRSKSQKAAGLPAT